MRTELLSSLRRRRRSGWLAVAALAVTTVAAATVPVGSALGAVPAQSNGTSDGIMCEPNPNGQNAFSLDATSGYVTTPDGNSVYMWSYTASGRAFQLPGPTLCVTAGTKVTVTLKNTLPEPVSILWPGQDDVAVGGQPAAPEFDGSGNLSSLTNSAAASTGTVTYSFTAGRPGTYLYSSGTDVTKQREMGLYGALVVRPVGHDTWANDDATSEFDSTTEFLFMLSQIDPDFHSAVEKNRAYNANTSTARYFFINGRSMPDTLAPNNASWMPSQPYGALVHIRANAAKPALIRYVDAGPVDYAFHPHGSSQRVINRDGSPVKAADGSDASIMKFLLDVGPGQTVDSLERFDNVYDPSGAGGASCSNVDAVIASQCAKIPTDIQLPQLQDQIVGPGTETWFSENPYLGGSVNPIPNNMVQNNQCGEFYHVAHSHALYQATNYGASFGGMMTLIRIDPAGGCK
jgi:FtsP/CotA-like multicopper oxidase with cupredoxin domain